jgi:hypothetical protein
MIKDVSGGHCKVQAIQHIDVYFFFIKKKVKKIKKEYFFLCQGCSHMQQAYLNTCQL